MVNALAAGLLALIFMTAYQLRIRPCRTVIIGR